MRRRDIAVDSLRWGAFRIVKQQPPPKWDNRHDLAGLAAVLYHSWLVSTNQHSYMPNIKPRERHGVYTPLTVSTSKEWWLQLVPFRPIFVPFVPLFFDFVPFSFHSDPLVSHLSRPLDPPRFFEM